MHLQYVTIYQLFLMMILEILAKLLQLLCLIGMHLQYVTILYQLYLMILEILAKLLQLLCLTVCTCNT